MRTSTFWLRAASLCALLLAVGHTSATPWTPAEGAEGAAVVQQMKAVHFPVLGVDASYWNFYVGFGISISCYMAVLAIVIFQLSGMVHAAPGRVRAMTLTLLVAYVVNGVLAWMYFFAPPAVLSGLTAGCLAVAYARIGRDAVHIARV